MALQYSLYLLVAPLSAIAALGGLLILRRHDRHAGRDLLALQWLVVWVVGWVVLETLALVDSSPQQTLFWTRLSSVFAVTTPVAWLLFTLRRTGRAYRATTRLLMLLAVVPALILGIAVVGDWYTLLWREYTFVAVNGMLAMRVIRYGTAFWLMFAHGNALILTGVVLLAHQYLTSLSRYHRHSRLMVAGGLLPVAAGLVHVSQRIPWLQQDYTAVSFAWASTLVILGMWRYRPFEVRPIARDVVVDLLDDAVIGINRAGRIVDLNAAARALIRAVPKAEARGRPIGRDVRHVLAGWPALADILPAREERSASLTLEAADGPRYYECRVVPLKDPRRRRAGEVVILHEVTSHKETEAELVQAARSLEQQNRELDAFARTVAHDLKNPLTVIAGYIEMLNDDWEEMSAHDVRTFLRAVSDSGDWMAHIVDELLLLAGVRQMERVPDEWLDMAPIVSMAVRQLERLIHDTGARVSVAEAWPPVIGHPPWVTEVWINYLSNALKYGGRPELGLAPEVTLGFDANAGDGCVRFWVRDKGPGIPLEKQSRLFIEFSRVNGGELQVPGHGLGLSIVQRIVDKLGGEVGVESKPGDGSTFWFTLPRADITVPAPVRQQIPPRPQETPADTLHAARGRTPE